MGAVREGWTRCGVFEAAKNCLPSQLPAQMRVSAATEGTPQLVPKRSELQTKNPYLII